MLFEVSSNEFASMTAQAEGHTLPTEASATASRG
jgi:hypothetical protein